MFFLFGSGVSYKSNVPDWIGPWSANIVIALISVYIMITRTETRLKGLEEWKQKWLDLNIFRSKLGKAFVFLIRRRVK
jgi:hypothetical protein